MQIMRMVAVLKLLLRTALKVLASHLGCATTLVVSPFWYERNKVNDLSSCAYVPLHHQIGFF